MSPAKEALHLPMSPLSSRFLAPLLCALPGACTLGSPPEWPQILAEVRAEYPEVPQVSIHELEARPREAWPLLLDSRSEPEFAVSHLAGALWAKDEDAALEQLEGLDREREILVYCSVGMRSSDLAEKLRLRGFSRVANLEGGIFAWANAGLPTYVGDREVSAVHPFNRRWGTLLVPDRRAE